MAVSGSMLKVAAVIVCVLAAGCSGASQVDEPLRGGDAGAAGKSTAVAGAAGAEDPGDAGSAGELEAGSDPGGVGSSSAGQGGAGTTGTAGSVVSVGGSETTSAGQGGTPGTAGSSAGHGGTPSVGGSSAGQGGAPTSTGGAPGGPCPYHTTAEGISPTSHRLSFTWTTTQTVLAVDLTPLAGYSVTPFVDGLQTMKAFQASGMWSIPPINRMKSLELEITPNPQTPVMPAAGLDLYCKQ